MYSKICHAPTPHLLCSVGVWAEFCAGQALSGSEPVTSGQPGVIGGREGGRREGGGKEEGGREEGGREQGGSEGEREGRREGGRGGREGGKEGRSINLHVHVDCHYAFIQGM